MANINTKRKRKSGIDGYGKKRGHALATGLGEKHGSTTRTKPWLYKQSQKQGGK